jgi:DNA end-binding protein Ku
MRSIASLSLSFGLVSIPVKLYTATEAAAALRFKWMSRGGARLRQRYVADALPEPPEQWPDTAAPGLSSADEVRADAAATRAATRPRGMRQAAFGPPPAPSDPETAAGDVPPRAQPAAIEEIGAEVMRSEMVKGYEYEKGKFVLFTAAELDALRAQARDSVDIVAFIPAGAVDPIYYDKAYLLAPDRRGERTYALLLRALQRSGRSALAQWAWKGKGYVVQIRAARGGLVLQTLFYADEVRVPEQLGIASVDVGDAELQLALQLIEQSARDAYDPHEFVDVEKQRILQAVQQKIAGRRTVSHAPPTAQAAPNAEVIDLMAALRASLRPGTAPATSARKPAVRARALDDAAAPAARKRKTSR